MKISKTFGIPLILMLLSGIGTMTYTTLETIHNNKIESVKTNINLNTLNNKFDTFIDLHQSQNIAFNKRLDAFSDSLNCYKIDNAKDHQKVFKSIEQFIYIEKKTNKQFFEMYNTLNLTYEQKN